MVFYTSRTKKPALKRFLTFKIKVGMARFELATFPISHRDAKPGYATFPVNNIENKKPFEKSKGSLKVGMARFELATSWSQTRRDNRATLHPELLVTVFKFGRQRYRFIPKNNPLIKLFKLLIASF